MRLGDGRDGLMGLCILLPTYLPTYLPDLNTLVSNMYVGTYSFPFLSFLTSVLHSRLEDYL